MNRTKLSVLILIVLAIVAWTGFEFFKSYQSPPYKIQGQIESQQYSISSKLAGRVDKVMVRKGDIVAKGDLIFTLHTPEIEAKLQQAQAGQSAAGALAKQAQVGARQQQIKAAEDQWRKAKAAAQLLEKTYQRVNSLYQDGVIAEQKRDEAKTQWQAAEYTESAAFQMYQLTKEGARIETKQAAEAKERMAAGAVAEVEAYAEDAQIYSWFNGEVSQVLLHSGELAPQGFPVVTVIDTLDSWAVLNVREDKLKHFEKGQQFSAYLPALDKSITFEVSHIAVMGDFATWRATDSSQGFDLRTFEVEAHPVDNNIPLRMGMSLMVEL